jgi:hypothetical protein
LKDEDEENSINTHVLRDLYLDREGKAKHIEKRIAHHTSPEKYENNF